MTKARHPVSIERALCRISGILDWPEMGRIVSRDARTVRAWSEPDRQIGPTLHHAILLDAAYRRAGGKGAPLHEAFGYLVEAACTDLYPTADELAQRAVRCIKEGGEANAAIVLASRPDATQEDRSVAAREVREAIEELSQTLPLLTQGAGPIGITGEGSRGAPS
ncbi:hypothetical protein [Sphingomonas bacterium]|uniref:hypothetical protein n=1 Tax=Sphingomonas bacterium TaxID=1895847 RepID=UPI0015753B8F|nr:hypothetical protein [Sphingomonas bacterium]